MMAKLFEKCFQSWCPKTCVTNLTYVKGLNGELLYVENNNSFVNPPVIYFNIKVTKEMKKKLNINTELY